MKRVEAGFTKSAQSATSRLIVLISTISGVSNVDSDVVLSDRNVVA